MNRRTLILAGMLIAQTIASSSAPAAERASLKVGMTMAGQPASGINADTSMPEGFAVALPIYYATGSRARALGFAALSGLAEPLGALLAYLAFGQHLGDRGMAALMAAVAGVMVFLALDQLLPNAKRYGVGHESVYGLVVGMLIMAVTLSWLL